jgi:hypothetical protein
MEKQRIKKTRATVQKQIQQQRQENAEIKPSTTKTKTRPIEIPQPFLKKLGHLVNLQEGSCYSYPQLVHLTAV